MAELARMLRQSRQLDWLRLAGGVVLTVGIALLIVRKQDDWGALIRFGLTALPCAALYATALAITRPGQRLEPWQTGLMVAAAFLLLLTLASLADLLGASRAGIHGGMGFWVSAAVAAAAAWVALRFHSPVHTLIAAVAAIAALLYFVDWTGGPLGLDTARDLLVAVTLAYWSLAYAARRYAPHLDRLHSDHVVVVGALAGIGAGLIGIGIAHMGLLSTSLEEGDPSADGWEVFLLVVSLLSIGFAVWQSHRASAYAGLLGLGVFIILVGSGGGLVGWPIVLIALGCGAVAASFAGSRAPPA